ncbi:MAG: DUF732 domain-containing protein [Mycobacterium sp.]
MQRVESGSLSKRSGTVWLMVGVMAPAACLLAGCGSGADLMSNVALPSQQTEDFVDGVGVPSTADGLTGSGRLNLTDPQRGYLDALLSAGIHPSSELRALSIGSYVCQARAAGQRDQAVWEYVAPMVRSDVADAQAATPQLPAAIPADEAIAGYIRIASDRLC